MTFKDIELLKNEAYKTATNFKNSFKNGEDTNEDYKLFITITEQALDIEESLGILLNKARESKH